MASARTKIASSFVPFRRSVPAPVMVVTWMPPRLAKTSVLPLVRVLPVPGSVIVPPPLMLTVALLGVLFSTPPVHVKVPVTVMSFPDGVEG